MPWWRMASPRRSSMVIDPGLPSPGGSRGRVGTWPQRKLRRKVPRVDGALTAQPRTPAVPPARSASASSMQSPPAGGGDQRQHLVPPVGPPWRAAEVKVMVDEFPQAQVPGEGGRQEQAGIGHQAVTSKAMRIRSGLFCGSIYWVLLLSGRVSVPKPLSQIQRSTLRLLQGLSPRPSIGGFGLN